MEEVDAAADGPMRGRIFDERAADLGQLRSKSSENLSSLFIRVAAEGEWAIGPEASGVGTAAGDESSVD